MKFWIKWSLGLLFLVSLWDAAQAQAPTCLPIEVMGAAKTTVPVSFFVPKSPIKNQGYTLWLKMHGLSYANKASIQINTGDWIMLNNSTVTVIGTAARYGGIGGAFSTLKLTLPVLPGTLQPGETNRINFRFNATDGVSSGFRVLEFNFLTSSGERLLPVGTFVEDNPNRWTPPFADDANIMQGRQLWQNAVLRSSSLSNAQNIQARCSDCHARDGRDLKYFNFSNLSIIERAKFHGLTQVQGQQIASYIRTLQQPNPGRPWNPPYQPGPGLDSKPVQEWAAGAGVDWVLDNDLDTIGYIFPNGIIEQAVTTSGNLNAREIPIAMQLPDWNHWLPKIHPKDAWGSAFVNSNLLKKFDGEGGGDSPWNFRAYLKAAGKVRNFTNANAYIVAQYGLRNDLGYWGNDRYTFLVPRTEGSNIAWSPEYSEKVYGTALWQLVKMWELMQEFNLEGSGQQVYGATAEPRTWLTDFPFRVSPFMLKIPNNQNGIGDSGLTNDYLSNAWYQAQLILNNSNRQPFNTTPIDWGYVYGKQKDLFEQSRNPEIMRVVFWLVKAMQVTDNGIGPEDYYRGWRPSMVGDISKLVHWNFQPMWRDVPPVQKARIMEALLRTWFAKTRQYTPQQYYRALIADPSYVPTWWMMDGQFGDKVMYMIPKFREAGVSGELLDEIADWAATVWPRGNWAGVR